MQHIFFLHVLYSICMQGLIPNRGEQDELITMNTPLLDSVPPGDDVFFTDGQQQLGMYILVQYVSCVYYSVGSEEWYNFVRNSRNTIFQQVCYIIGREGASPLTHTTELISYASFHHVSGYHNVSTCFFFMSPPDISRYTIYAHYVPILIDH